MTQNVQLQPAPRRLPVPKAPVLVLSGQRLHALTLDGELAVLDVPAARRLVEAHMPIVCHAPQVARHLGLDVLHAYDVLSLFAFVRPGTTCVPTPRGIARALHLIEPETPEDQCLALRDATRHLLADLAAQKQEGGREERSDPAAIAAMMGLAGGVNDETAPQGWPWAPAVLAALQKQPGRGEIRAGVKIWDRLPEWAVHAPPPPPGHHGVSADEAGARLQKLLHRQHREDRPQQQDYAAAIAAAFDPREDEDTTRVVLAEAGTGTGKTLGYLAPATVWAEKNGGAVWISTYTRNLQRQIDAELEGLYDDPAVKARKVVTRKGRENYLCLLNLEDETVAPAVHTGGERATALGLMLRWAAVTGDGDLAGRDFPGWLPGLLGRGRVHAFADRRGECIYAACPHFNKCFTEKSIRKAKRADIVIANHALVMSQAAAGADEDMPQRYVFDEGHHIFEAADSAFCAHLNGAETADLRRWILGSETSQKSRLRGVRRRLEDLIASDDAARAETDRLVEAAQGLPGHGWRERLGNDAPKGATETFLALCRRQVLARCRDDGPYSLETALAPPLPGLPEAAAALSARLKDIQRPMQALALLLEKKMEDEAETLDTESRDRLRFMAQSLRRRGRDVAGAWIAMLDSLAGDAPDGFADWLEITRIDGVEHDTGFYRHYIDPARVFAQTLKPVAHGVAVTSATLRDPSSEDAAGWTSALARAGAPYLDETSGATTLFATPSPFDYAGQTRILVLKDVDKARAEEVAGACRALFSASGGGALGVFTAVQRLRAVHQRIAKPLDALGIPLYAQHAGDLDVATLVDLFREEENACLLGTDATRDGIDVPGRSLRLVVYDRVPWPRPTILHKARRAHFGRDYDDMLTRFRLKQAYGRLIRKADDRGVFVMLDGALPSRLLSAFPPGVEVQKTGLKEAVEIIQRFL